MARENGSTRRGRPPKAAPDPGNFTSTELKKFEAVYNQQKASSQEANTRLSETFKAAINKGADRKALRFYGGLLLMDAAKAWAVFDSLRFMMETGKLSSQQDWVRGQQEEARAAQARERETEAAI